MPGYRRGDEQRLGLSRRDRRRRVSSGHAFVPARRSASSSPKRVETCGLTSPSDAHAASFSPSAASDWPSRNSASGALAWALVLGRDIEEGFGGIAEALALEQALAEPVVGFAGAAGRSDACSGKRGRPPRRAHSPCAAHGRRRGRYSSFGACRHARRRGGRRAAVGLRVGDCRLAQAPVAAWAARGDIERLTGRASTGRADRDIVSRRARGWRAGAGSEPSVRGAPGAFGCRRDRTRRRAVRAAAAHRRAPAAQAWLAAAVARRPRAALWRSAVFLHAAAHAASSCWIAVLHLLDHRR